MRLIALSTITSSMALSACGLGVVDLPADPTPARLWVTSELAPDSEDPSQVRVQVDAALDPGIDLDREPRRVASNSFQVEDSTYAPVPLNTTRPSWQAVTSFPAPGPEGIRLGLPQVAGLGLAQSITMRVRVDATPGDTLVVPRDGDLVVGADRPSNPAEAFHWSLYLASDSLPGFSLRLGGADAWPTAVRVPGSDIPEDAFPLRATLRVRWNRSLDIVELTPTERYELVLGSLMVVDWTVVRESVE